MSTIWTPSGEQPIRRDEPEPERAPQAPADAGAPTRTGPGGPGPADGPETEEELRAHMAEVERELASTPASVVVVNHCIGLFQLAALHLAQQPPRLEDAKLAIDAMGAVVEGLGPRLGEDSLALQEALSSIRLGFVQAQRSAGETDAAT